MSDIEQRLQDLHERWSVLEQEMREAGLTIEGLLSEPVCHMTIDNDAESRVEEQMTDETVDEQILEQLERIRGEVAEWVRQSEDRLEGLERQCVELAEQVEAQAKQAREEHSQVGLWTRQMYGRITQTERMLKNLAVSIARSRTPVRMPPLNKVKT